MIEELKHGLLLLVSSKMILMTTIRDGHICFSGVSRNKKEEIVCVWISLYGLNPMLAHLEAGFLKATF